MGNSESVVRNVDKRSSRREHKPMFQSAIVNYRMLTFAETGQQLEMEREQEAVALSVCVRKRPIFEHEQKQGEFDVATAGSRSLVLHDARLHPDMRNAFMNHNTFRFDRVFGEGCDNDDVYRDGVAPLVRDAAGGGNSTVMMYGQTGSGKTFTMSAIYERAARELFERLRDGDGVSVSFFELAGLGVRDMLNAGQQSQLYTDVSGEVQVVPCVEVPCRSADELLRYIGLATSLRATAATGVHDASSRSHAVCRIHVGRLAKQVRGGGGARKPAAPRRTYTADELEGTLTLVDLAGSEQKGDSKDHDAQRRKEGAEINASLMALKDCVRSMARGDGWRSLAGGRHPLTQLLKSSFTGARARTVVIATVSPSSKDTEHSLNTLRHACIMDGQGEGSETRFVTGGEVEKQMLGEIDTSGAQARLRAKRDAQARDGPGSIGGYSEKSEFDGDEASRRKAKEAQLAKARARAERQAMKQLHEDAPEQFAALKQCREALLPSMSELQKERAKRRMELQFAAQQSEREEGGGGGKTNFEDVAPGWNSDEATIVEKPGRKGMVMQAPGMAGNGGKGGGKTLAGGARPRVPTNKKKKQPQKWEHPEGVEEPFDEYASTSRIEQRMNQPRIEIKNSPPRRVQSSPVQNSPPPSELDQLHAIGDRRGGGGGGGGGRGRGGRGDGGGGGGWSGRAAMAAAAQPGLSPMFSDEPPSAASSSGGGGGAERDEFGRKVMPSQAVQLGARHYEAKSRREEAEKQRISLLRSRSKSGGPDAASSSSSGAPLAAQIAELEQQMMATDVSSATKFGLKKRVASLKAAKIKEDRVLKQAREQAQRERGASQPRRQVAQPQQPQQQQQQQQGSAAAAKFDGATYAFATSAFEPETVGEGEVAAAPGMRFEILADDDEHWVEVRGHDGTAGFVPRECIEARRRQDSPPSVGKENAQLSSRGAAAAASASRLQPQTAINNAPRTSNGGSGNGSGGASFAVCVKPFEPADGTELRARMHERFEVIANDDEHWVEVRSSSSGGSGFVLRENLRLEDSGIVAMASANVEMAQQNVGTTQNEIDHLKAKLRAKSGQGGNQSAGGAMGSGAAPFANDYSNAR